MKIMRVAYAMLAGLSAVVLVAGTATSGAAAGASSVQVTGAGSTFAAPIYGKWAEAAGPATGVVLNYQAVGSGAGQNQAFNRTVDFGASDAPLPADKLRAHDLLQFPTVMGAVDVIVNIPGVQPNELRLTGPVLAAIYRGTVTTWDDPQIARLNPGLKLPGVAIAPVYRADGSGTTYVFTSYLAAVSPDWKAAVGAATNVSWPAGNGARGSDGVAGTVRNIRGGIGYVESAYATNKGLTTVQLQNRAGQFVSPSLAAFAAAAANADWTAAQNFAIDLNNQPGQASWPIVSATFVLLPKDPADGARAAAVLKLFDWAFRSGDGIATALQYVPLPATVKAAVRTAWRQVTVNGQPVYK